MNMNTNGVSFSARYALIGNSEQTNKAAGVIKSIVKDDVEFFPVTCKDNKIIIVATDNDAVILRNKKQENINPKIKELCSDKKNFLSNLFKFMFGTDENAPIVQGGQLARFILPTTAIDYKTGLSKSKYKSAEKFVDGTIKEYSLKGRLCKVTRPDGYVEHIGLDGSKIILKPGEELPLKPAKKEKASQIEQAASEKIKIDTSKQTSRNIAESISKTSPKKKFVSRNGFGVAVVNVEPKSEKKYSNTAIESRETKAETKVQKDVLLAQEAVKNDKTTQMKIVDVDTLPVLAKNYIQDRDRFDSKRRLVSRTFCDGIEAKYHYVGDSRELLFTYYSDGHIETNKGVVDNEKLTVAFPHRDGIIKVVDKDGYLSSFVFPDGVVKNYDRDERIVDKVYPNGKRELFTKEGRMFLIIHPDGSYEDVKPISPNSYVF